MKLPDDCPAPNAGRLICDGGVKIPDRLKNDEYLLRVYGPEANCDHPGKQPVGSATEGPFYHGADPVLHEWIENGGNVGKALVGPMVVFDIDHPKFREIVDDHLPGTFTVRSGSGGEHRYYRAPGWDDDKQITVDGTDYGSIRSDGWQVVIPPSIHAKTGEPYRVQSDRPVKALDTEEIETVIEAVVETTDSQHSGGAAAGGGGGCVGSTDVPDEYPARSADWDTARSWLASNDLLKKLNRSSGDRSAREFLLAKCLAEGGFSEGVISDALDRLPHDSKWHERGEDYRTRTVRKAIVAACQDEYVDFSTGDMAARAAESRKTEESGEGRTLTGGDSMVDFSDHEEVTVLEGNEEGDSFKKVVRSTRTEDGDTVEYVALKSGRIEMAQTTGGDEVLVERVTDSASLGSPEYIDDLGEALLELHEKVNGD